MGVLGDSKRSVAVNYQGEALLEELSAQGCAGNAQAACKPESG